MTTKIKMTHKEFIEAVMRAKAKAFNDKYDPMINGFEVEIYVEPAGDENNNEIPDEVEELDTELNEGILNKTL